MEATLSWKTLPAPESLPDTRGALLRHPCFHAFLLLVVGFLVRLPALQGTPLWDDDYLVAENPFIRSPLLIPEAFRHYLFPDGFGSHYRPVQNVSFALDYWFWNTDAYGFHLTNVLLHLTSAVFLYLLLRRLLPGLVGRTHGAMVAFAVAFLWVLHPVHSAAIDYISGRADSLAFAFASGGWLLFLRAEQGAGRRKVAGYLGAALCGLLALASRESALVWLGIFLLHTFAFRAGLSWKWKATCLAACLALVAGYAGLRSLPQRQSGPPKSEPTSAPVRAVLMLRALGDYGRLMLCPTTLYMERSVLDPENYLNTPSWRKSVKTEYLSLSGALLLAAFAFGCARRGAGRQLRVFGSAWFFAGYLPVSNLLDLNANVAEHWLYLPSVGFLLVLAGWVLEFSPRGQRVAVVVALLAAGGLGGRAYVRSTDWVSPKIFYQRTMTAGGSSTRVAANLGLIYLNEGEYVKAESIFRRILQLTPDYPTARNNLAEALYRQGKHAEGEAMFTNSKVAAQETRKEYPRTWVAALNLAHIRHNAHDDAAAIVLLEQARKDYPNVWQIIRFESEVLRQTEGPAAAAELVSAFAVGTLVALRRHDRARAIARGKRRRRGCGRAIAFCQLARCA